MQPFVVELRGELGERCLQRIGGGVLANRRRHLNHALDVACETGYLTTSSLFDSFSVAAIAKALTHPRMRRRHLAVWLWTAADFQAMGERRGHPVT